MSEALPPDKQFKALRDEYRTLEQREAAIHKRKAEIKILIADLMLSLPGSPPKSIPADDKPDADESGRGEQLVALLRQHRGAPQKLYAEKLYGDPKMTGRVSSLLDYLRKTGKARTYAHGKWEAVS